MMPSISVSRWKSRGPHLNATDSTICSSRETNRNIFPATLNTRCSPHWRTTVACGIPKAKTRSEARRMTTLPQEVANFHFEHFAGKRFLEKAETAGGRIESSDRVGLAVPAHE